MNVISLWHVWLGCMIRGERKEDKQRCTKNGCLRENSYKVEYMILLAHTSLKVTNTSFIYNTPSCSVP